MVEDNEAQTCVVAIVQWVRILVRISPYQPRSSDRRLGRMVGRNWEGVGGMDDKLRGLLHTHR
jgi:hypothetical protein